MHDVDRCRRIACGNFQLLERSGDPRSPFERVTVTRMIDEDPPHRAGGKRYEMFAILPCALGQIREAKIGFVDERGRLKRVVGALAAQRSRSQTAQFVLDARKQLSRCLVVVITSARARLIGRPLWIGHAIRRASTC
jgi:hypothetical protein